MKRSNKEDTIVHYIPEFYNDNINDRTGKPYGWIPVNDFKKPYISKKCAEEQIFWKMKNYQDYNRPKFRIRTETFRCVDVKFEEIY